MIYLPLLLVDELSFRARDLMVGLIDTHTYIENYVILYIYKIRDVFCAEVEL